MQVHKVTLSVDFVQRLSVSKASVDRPTNPHRSHGEIHLLDMHVLRHPLKPTNMPTLSKNLKMSQTNNDQPTMRESPEQIDYIQKVQKLLGDQNWHSLTEGHLKPPIFHPLLCSTGQKMLAVAAFFLCDYQPPFCV